MFGIIYDECIKYYSMKTFNGMMFIPSFMKIHQLVQKLVEGGADMQT
jgi:hypothetical protein